MCWKQMLTQAMQCEQKLLKASMDMVAWILSASKCQFWCCLWWLHQRSISVTGLHSTWYRQNHTYWNYLATVLVLVLDPPWSWFEPNRTYLKSHKVTLGYYLVLVLSSIWLCQSHVWARWVCGSAAAETGAKVAPALLLSTLLCLAPPWSPNRHQNRHCWWQAVALSLPPKPPLRNRSCRIVIATELNFSAKISFSIIEDQKEICGEGVRFWQFSKRLNWCLVDANNGCCQGWRLNLQILGRLVECRRCHRVEMLNADDAKEYECSDTRSAKKMVDN